ncbi:MAG: hypothetical protein OEY77_01265 [Nitrospira sp.]|nr:hypothetical protein [Nitrospira sp.]
MSRSFLVHFPLTMTEQTLQNSLPQKAVEALVQGDRDEAIKQVMLEGHYSREEARDMIANFLLTQPSLLRRMKDTQSEAKWGRMGWLILFQAIAVAIGYFLFFRDQW